MTIRNDSTKSSEYQVLGPAIDSRAQEPTQLVPGMNGPDGSWNQYQYQTKYSYTMDKSR